MKTASWFTYTGPGRVSISRGTPGGARPGFKVFRALAPGPWFKTVERPEFERLYGAQLRALNPETVMTTLLELVRDPHNGAHVPGTPAPEPVEPVLLCWERPPFTETNWCHRRMVALWFEASLGIEVPELVPARR